MALSKVSHFWTIVKSVSIFSTIIWSRAPGSCFHCLTFRDNVTSRMMFPDRMIFQSLMHNDGVLELGSSKMQYWIITSKRFWKMVTHLNILIEKISVRKGGDERAKMIMFNVWSKLRSLINVLQLVSVLRLHPRHCRSFAAGAVTVPK